jgi:hypothetical protein
VISWWVLLPFILAGFVVGWYMSRQYHLGRLPGNLAMAPFDSTEKGGCFVIMVLCVLALVISKC